MIRTCNNAAFQLCGGCGSTVDPLFSVGLKQSYTYSVLNKFHTEKLGSCGAMHHVNVWAFDLVIRQANTQFTVLKCRSDLCRFPSIGEGTCCIQLTLVLSLTAFQYLVNLLSTSVSPLFSFWFASGCRSLPIAVPGWNFSPVL